MWFGLHGLQLLGFVLVGFVVIGGGIFLLFALGIKAMASALSKSLDHNPSECALPNCYQCMERRRRAWEKRPRKNAGHSEQRNMLPQEDPTFVSTRELNIGDGVSLGNSVYRVIDLLRDQKGTGVVLRNLQTQRQVIVTVWAINLDRKIWHPLRKWGPS